MKYIIYYTPLQKELLEYALNMALSWHQGDIEPVCKLMLKAHRRHRPRIEITEDMYRSIRRYVQSLRDLDYKGEAFGKYDVLKGITLSDKGESTISEEEADALQTLCEYVMRLMVGQLNICFNSFYITYLDHHSEYELLEIAAFLKFVCWDKQRTENYGIRYSEESDILYDIYHVLRYARYLNFSEECKEILWISNYGDSPLHVAKEPPMEIKTIK